MRVDSCFELHDSSLLQITTGNCIGHPFGHLCVKFGGNCLHISTIKRVEIFTKTLNSVTLIKRFEQESYGTLLNVARARVSIDIVLAFNTRYFSNLPEVKQKAGRFPPSDALLL